jgi:hypothetical protein
MNGRSAAGNVNTRYKGDRINGAVPDGSDERDSTERATKIKSGVRAGSGAATSILLARSAHQASPRTQHQSLREESTETLFRVLERLISDFRRTRATGV